jgi:hypothetical protein
MSPDEPSELENCENLLDSWIDSLEELSEIQDAFAVDGKIDMNGKTILDVGTDCVKPLYLALKFKPERIVGIDENLPKTASGILLKSRLFTETKIRFYNCNFLDDSNLDRILRKEKMGKFDFVLVSKMLHHLRTGECVKTERNGQHDCKKDRTEKDCIYAFHEQEIFERLLAFGKRAVVYEYFYPDEEDDDKIRGRGGYFTAQEWSRIFRHLCGNYRVEFFKPQRFTLENETINKANFMLKRTNCVCFYVEKTAKRNIAASRCFKTET